MVVAIVAPNYNWICMGKLVYSVKFLLLLGRAYKDYLSSGGRKEEILLFGAVAAR